MHLHLRREATILNARQAWRAACALGCVAAVVGAHGLLWWAATHDVVPGVVRAAAVQVRQVIVPAVAQAPPEILASSSTSGATPTSGAVPVSRAAPAMAARTRVESPARVATPPKASTGNTPAREHDDAVANEGDASPTVGALVDPAMPSTAAAVETYATHIPAPVLLNYVLQRGTAAGDASLHWQVDGDHYVLQLQGTLPQGRVVEQRSLGGFDEAGLAPLRLADRRRGRDVRAANFQREQRKISFSGPRVEWPLPSGAQDRLSWLVQLVAIAAAPDAMREGAQWSMWVAGTRGALSVWRFEVRGRQQWATPRGEVSAWWLVREPAHPYDLRVEVWLDPARGPWPVRLRQTQVPGGEPLEWLLRDDAPALGS
jgi:hypothetical protein